MHFYSLRFRFKFGLFLLFVSTLFAAWALFMGYAHDSYLTAPVGQYWFDASPGTLNMVQAAVQRYLMPEIWDWIQNVILESKTIVAMGWVIAGGNAIGFLLTIWGLRPE